MSEAKPNENSFQRTRMRDAEFIKPPNLIKAKVGSGGLSDEVLERTQKLLESHATDFAPLGEMYLQQMLEGIEITAKSMDDNDHKEEHIALILYPCVQLKANGGMFHYPLITRLAAIFVNFMEVVERIDPEVLEIARAFNSTLSMVLSGKVTSDGGPHADALANELSAVCHRYFDKHKAYINSKQANSESDNE